MESMIAFDTHAYVKKLRSAGVSEEQAEVQAQAMLELMESRVATKEDFRLLREQMATKEDLRELEARMASKGDLREIGSRIDSIESRMASKEDLKAFVTRAEMYRALLIQTGAILASMFAMLQLM
ncbi:DUF1640 domain-containing protein [Thioalkalivibrio sp. HL-Eb18]|uniref:DUF1640 domain-containing protein n=1 Tax=Thioalkalivibrio sp. HL-Eb18 TaxID=1266913 RepID=UPI000364959C|nr:DUF1640 domain-containing protein [Thioalkalivibrio sp. HL-Eb18]